MPSLYIIAGCNGAGKTTASFTILPEILNCREFVNADSIAAGLSPFNVESVAFEAGRIMLERIRQLMKEGENFAFETTLATRSYVGLVRKAQEVGYEVSLLYFWLRSPQAAKQRVARRASKGGHHIPFEVIERRYYRGIENLFNLYIPVVDNWLVIDNRYITPGIIAIGSSKGDNEILNTELWNYILKQKKK